MPFLVSHFSFLMSHASCNPYVSRLSSCLVMFLLDTCSWPFFKPILPPPAARTAVDPCVKSSDTVLGLGSSSRASRGPSMVLVRGGVITPVIAAILGFVAVSRVSQEQGRVVVVLVPHETRCIVPGTDHGLYSRRPRVRPVSNRLVSQLYPKRLMLPHRVERVSEAGGEGGG